MNEILTRYARRFFVKIEQCSVQGDHIHLLVRTTRRSHFHYFFRVVAGQIAQRFHDEGRLAKRVGRVQVTDTPTELRHRKKSQEGTGLGNAAESGTGTGLWKSRPFSRVVAKGRRAYTVVRNYIQLNEQEALGKIAYKKERLRGLSLAEWERLWA